MSFAQYLSQPRVRAVHVARELGVSHTTVIRWRDGQVPAERVRAVSRVTGLSPHELRPDLFDDPRAQSVPQDAVPCIAHTGEAA